ncbi:hypothetical protein [Aneurinibacillus terranovensis]|uniref:hypothetical protein n=1 Tax=Aneurinibacillus terranovensis TaxID=278991 RepID=UPI000420DC6E|nr:hypothetical protein [Aneurinibacillus terranovensis]
MARKDEPNLPDFKQLNDRIIAGPTEGPFIVAETNLDKKMKEELNGTTKTLS